MYGGRGFLQDKLHGLFQVDWKIKMGWMAQITCGNK